MDDFDRDPVDCLAEEFTARRRGGETLSVETFAAEHPEHAHAIRDLFPAIAAMERVKDRQPRQRDGRVALPGNLPEQLGDYRILLEIGRGGMGVVYEAQQVSLARRVAVKVLPRQSLLTGKSLRRFEREARTAAKLHHTNIVPVFGVGEQDGYHYIVMQLIHGVGLDEVLTELRRSAGVEGPLKPVSPRSTRARQKAAALLSQDFGQLRSPGGSNGPEAEIELSETDHRALPTDQRTSSSILAVHELGANPTDSQTLDPTPSRSGETLDPTYRAESHLAAPLLQAAYWRNVARIGMQVSEALHYAHQQGTLHRDIKPGNLLLDTNATVWVADFGLAKLTEQDDVSQTGDVVGTLNYIAPEALSGKTDGRSDIYSLGLTLYELLTLRSAYGGKTHARVLEEVRRASPRRPSLLQPGIPRDLETIVLKAIAAEPVRRYQTAGELAEDLHRYLEDRPVLARRTSPIEHAWRWCRRNRALATLSAISLGSLVLYASLASVGYLRLTNLTNALQATTNELQQKTDELEQQKREAEQGREAAVLAQAQEAAFRTLAVESLDSMFVALAPDRLVDATAVIVDTNDESSDDETPVIQTRAQPALSSETAVLMEKMRIYYDKFVEHSEGNEQLQFKAAVASRKVGDALFLLGKSKEAEAAFRRAVDRYPQVDPRNAASALETGTDKARALNGLALTLNDPWQFRDALERHHEALAVLRASAGTETPTPAWRMEEARTLLYLSRFSFEGRGGGGRRDGESRDEGRRRGGVNAPPPGPPPPGSPLGPPPTGQPPGRPDRDPPPANNYRQQAIAGLESLAREFPNEPEYRYVLALAYRTPGPSPWYRPSADDPSQQLAIDLLEQLVKEYPAIADYRHELCQAYAGEQFVRRFGDFRGGVSAERLDRALAIAQQLVAESPNIPRFAETLAQVLRQRGLQAIFDRRWPEAESDLRASVEILGDLTASLPDDFHYRIALRDSRVGLARALAGQALASPVRGTESRAIMDEMIQETTQRAAADTGRGGRFSRGLLRMLLRSHADNLELMGDEPGATEARRQAEALGGPGPR